jgi:hypothetical protein
MKTVFIVNERAQPGESCLVRQPTPGERNKQRLITLFRPVTQNERAATMADVEQATDSKVPESIRKRFGEFAAAQSLQDFRREYEGTWLPPEQP